MTDTVDNKRPFDIDIFNSNEIRMGSPFNICEIKLRGTEIQIPEGGWRDKFEWSLDNKFLVLIQWNIDKLNDPGFNFYIIDISKQSVQISERIKGIIEDFRVSGEKIVYKIFESTTTIGLTKEFEIKANP
jgi:hypothetical protein